MAFVTGQERKQSGPNGGKGREGKGNAKYGLEAEGEEGRQGKSRWEETVKGRNASSSLHGCIPHERQAACLSMACAAHSGVQQHV